MIKTIIYGCNGKMGQVLSEELTNDSNFKIVAGVDRNTSKHSNTYPTYTSLNENEQDVDVVIDFSNPTYLEEILDYCFKKDIPLVTATTGFSEEDEDKIKSASESIPVFKSSNMSLGINVLSNVLKQISGLLDEKFDIEIIEKHHNMKIDAPSGTALLLADTINEALEYNKEYKFGRKGNDSKRQENEIGIHAIRGGTIVGEHSVLFSGIDEIIEIKHSALSKKVFATGAIKAARFLVVKQEGLYSMDDIFSM